MAELATIEIGEILGKLPEIVPFNIELLGDEPLDLLICCAGFESRSTAIVKNMKEAVIGNIIVIVYATNDEDNSNAINDFRTLNTLNDFKLIKYERSTFVENLRAALFPYRTYEHPHIAVDLSGMASFVFYRVFSTLFEDLPHGELGAYYSEALSYAPSREDWDNFFNNVPDPKDSLSIAEKYEQSNFQSKGVDVTYESDVFPGKNVGPVATEVIAIPNFSLQRMKSMLCHVESQYSVQDKDVRWYLGVPPDRFRNSWRYNALAALYNVQERGVGISTRDYKDIFQRLDRHWEESFANRHLIIATLGSKMQHVGCFLFLKTHPECGLLLCEPQEFIADQYSMGIGPIWWLNFGKIQEVHDLIASRGKLKFLWLD